KATPHAPDLDGYGCIGQGQNLCDIVQALRCGCSTDLSNAIADRAMFHADNAYYLPAVRIESHRCRTNTVSNTAFRGFGGPQGMLGVERIIHRIATELGRDPLEVRKANLYGSAPRNVTPYEMEITEPVLGDLMAELETRANYQTRLAEVEAFNAKAGIFRKGLALTPVKFGISFTTTFLNQAGALVHVYTDGSVHLNHGGTEMGQGLFVKVAQVVAETFSIDLDRVAVSATNTGKVPNTSATAASAGTDMNGMAARRAALTIRERLTRFAAELHQAQPEDVEWRRNRIAIRGEEMSWERLIKEAYLARTSLSSTGYYATPMIHYDATKMRGHPFFYFAHGAAVSEVIVDSLTGEHRIDRVDILHDVGKSLNPAIDLGQIEGGYIQGAGWLTMEELWWDDKGRLRTHAPSTYKIPTASDRPAVMNIDLWRSRGDHAETIFRSKAVGEPPLMLAISAFEALQMAVSSFASSPDQIAWLNAPATPEAVLLAVEATKRDAVA
ncbi:MAG: molybdopterin cofactor-binding domain-containing protein, partial [Pseudomonadota bacterium]